MEVDSLSQGKMSEPQISFSTRVPSHPTRRIARGYQSPEPTTAILYLWVTLLIRTALLIGHIHARCTTLKEGQDKCYPLESFVMGTLSMIKSQTCRCVNLIGVEWITNHYFLTKQPSSYNADAAGPAILSCEVDFTGFWNLWKASKGNKGAL